MGLTRVQVQKRAVLAICLGGLLGLAASAEFTCVATEDKAESYNASITHLGCFPDASVRVLRGGMISPGAANSPQYCADQCGSHGYKYAGVEYWTQCFCGQNIENGAQAEVDSSNCTSACPAAPEFMCGGSFYHVNIYEISNPAPTVTPINDFTPVCQTYPFCSSQACNQSLSIANRVASLINSMTTQEKITNMIDAASGSQRLGLPPYQWWTEALHGVASPGVSFTAPNGSNFSYATSFPMPLNLGAAFDDVLVADVAAVIGRESRAFANHGYAGFSFWTPNINPFRDPRWGRGPETPGEDVFHIQQYIRALVPGLQQARPGSAARDQPTMDEWDKQIIACCKHYAVYDVETGRDEFGYNPSQQEKAEYYLAPFKTCAKDVHVGQVMCSYNAVDGVPSCSSEYLLDTVLRDEWGFSAPYSTILSDCAAIEYIWNQHNFTDSAAAAAAVALNAGTDLECGSTYLNLNVSLQQNMTSMAQVDRALTRLYTSLHTVGYFDGSKRYGALGWSNVGLPDAQVLSYDAAVAGIVLLKNSPGVLPLVEAKLKKVALIGPWANATIQMQGNYYGTAPYLYSPLMAFKGILGAEAVVYAQGTGIASSSTEGFAKALEAAKGADAVIFVGGIDNSVESEGLDRTSIAWPGNQLDLIAQLATQARGPNVTVNAGTTATSNTQLIVVQCGGGQLDDLPLQTNPAVSAILWAGYPGQNGGYAIADVLLGKKSPAGRLPITQYRAEYAEQVSMFDPALRPEPTRNFPGRTYKWFSGEPVLPFGYGLHYTTFKAGWGTAPQKEYSIQDLARKAPGGNITEHTVFTSVSVNVLNNGQRTSDYVGLLFLSTENAGPAPYPNKWLVSYGRLHDLKSGDEQTLNLSISLGSLARVDEDGSYVLYPGDYTLYFDYDGRLAAMFTLTGEALTLEKLPEPMKAEEYKYSVPVHVGQPAFSGKSLG